MGIMDQRAQQPLSPYSPVYDICYFLPDPNLWQPLSPSLHTILFLCCIRDLIIINPADGGKLVDTIGTNDGIVVCETDDGARNGEILG